MLMLGRQVLEQLLRPDAVHKALCHGLQHTQLLVHVLHLVPGSTCHLACTSPLACDAVFASLVICATDQDSLSVLVRLHCLYMCCT